MTTEDSARGFDGKLDRIDAIVKELEGGRIGLERAVELFKEGKTLVRDCEATLKAARETVARATAEPGTT